MAVVVAHPDDETLGCGALLRRLEGATVIIATDGSPRKATGAQAHGFASASAYAAARSAELRAALRLAGVSRNACIELGIPDQGAAHALVPLARQLADLVVARGISVVLTHAYEGGHPDHDAVAFAAWAAASIVQREGYQLVLIEMPFYHLGQSGMIFQQFHDPPMGVQVTLNDAERALKARMIAAHATQMQMLAQFAIEHERFRAASTKDFQHLPNGGRLLYEAHDWGMAGQEWLTLTTSAMRELELETDAP